MAHDIFISYSSHDKTIADAIVAALENKGLRCWVAPRDIKPGADWGDSICEAITNCKLVLLIFSSSSNQSKRVLDEIYYAIGDEKVILPFRVENLAPTGAMRLHLSSRHWLDAYQPSWKAHIDQLVNSAWDMVGRPAQPQPGPAVPLPQVPAVAPPPVEKQARKKLPLLWIGLALAATLLVGAGAMWLVNGGGSSLLAAGDMTPSAPAATRTPIKASPTPGLKVITVTSAEDSGAGTLRQALLDAKAGDTINFDPAIFPPDNPTRIFLESELPNIWQERLTLNAWNAGVILDGSNMNKWPTGLLIDADLVSVHGLQVVNFGGPGITLSEYANHCKIGGERSLGLGNVFSGNSDGIWIVGSDNSITGNLVGTTADGIGQMGNRASGIVLAESASRNRIGPDNVIAFNGESEVGDIGIRIDSGTACGNSFTANSIFENALNSSDIIYNFQGAPACPHLEPPVILYADFDTGTAAGTTCSGCTVELFSSESNDGRVFEGSVIADEFGNFLFRGEKAFAGPFLTATSSGTNVNTSQFSFPADAKLPLVLAVEKMRQDAPLFETGFNNPWAFPVRVEEKAFYRFENGKLTVISMGERQSIPITDGLALESFAVEFVMNLRDASPDGHCFIISNNIHYDEVDRRTVAAGMHVQKRIGLGYYDYNQGDRDMGYVTPEDVSGDKNMRLILVGDQAAVFLDGALAFATLIPGGGDVYQQFALGGNMGVTCEYEDFKLWDLSAISAVP